VALQCISASSIALPVRQHCCAVRCRSPGTGCPEAVGSSWSSPKAACPWGWALLWVALLAQCWGSGTPRCLQPQPCCDCQTACCVSCSWVQWCCWLQAQFYIAAPFALGMSLPGMQLPAYTAHTPPPAFPCTFTSHWPQWWHCLGCWKADCCRRGSLSSPDKRFGWLFWEIATEGR